MKTLFTIGLLIVFGIIANFASVFILNIAGLPGALLAGKPGKRSKGQFIFGSVVSVIGQSFVYLAYTAFIVNWTMLAVSIQGVSFVAWPIAFLAVVIPLWMNLIRSRVEAKEAEHATPPSRGPTYHTRCCFDWVFHFCFCSGHYGGDL